MRAVNPCVFLCSIAIKTIPATTISVVAGMWYARHELILMGASP